MNILTNEKKTLVLSLLAEGNSIRSIERLSGVHRDTIMRLSVSVGELAANFMSEYMVNLNMNRVQVDEIWSYVGKHQRRLSKEQQADQFMGDQYCFVAMDSETKLIPCFLLGKRTGEMTRSFMTDLSSRITNRFQLSTDSFAPYKDVVDRIWGEDIDYGQIHKEYADVPESVRYSPARIIRVNITPITGNPKRKHISTSHIERSNLSMRMSMRRLTRLTNAYSKKWENLRAALCLYFWFYNFARVHESLRVTPAMQHGVCKRILTWNDLLNWQEQRIAA